MNSADGIWASFCRSLNAEPRDYSVLRGQSGLEHPVQALAVDDKGKRVIAVSAEPNPRTAALMQADIQATMPDVHVLIARPIIFDLGMMAKKVLGPFDEAKVNLVQLAPQMQRFGKLGERSRNRFIDRQFGRAMRPISGALANVTLPAISQILDVAQQAAGLDWRAIFQGPDAENGAISLRPLLEIDNLAVDRKYGICPIPLYELEEKDWEILRSGTRLDDIQQRLIELGIFQYFFPSPDALALGMIDLGIKEVSQVQRGVELAQELGHPLAGPEILTKPSLIPDLVRSLEEEGYVGEGELGIEISPQGQTVRANIKFRPREGILTKIINRFTVNASVSPKDFMGP